MQGLFNMASDSGLFKTADAPELADYKLKGNIYRNGDSRYLPLYEAKMLHQFDHRYSTYDGATQSQLNVGILPQPTPEQKRDPSFVVQPRYWVAEEEVDKAIPKYPAPLALAVKFEDGTSIRHVLYLWAAGYYLNRDLPESAADLLQEAASCKLDTTLARAFSSPNAEVRASELDRDYPLHEIDVKAITSLFSEPENLAAELIERFSPRWFLGWRDITNAGNERTLIAGAAPRFAIGHTFPLLFAPGVQPSSVVGLVANMNSLVADYVVRQKVGGTHITFGLLKQFALFSPGRWANLPSPLGIDWFSSRILELLYTAHDLTPLARDCGYDGPPFAWDEERRFTLRCELDAAFFHLYLPADSNGDWRPAKDETPEQLAALKKHFPKPRDAVAYILDQFPIVRQKDEKAHGGYRTKERILANYDEMLRAMK
jgi:hypothetical protein